MTAFKFIRPTTITDSAGSFARSTTATYFDVLGVMQTAAINVPRIGYDPVTHAHTGLILEGEAKNVIENGTAYCAGTSTTASTGTATGPDLVLATKVLPNAGAVSFPGSGNTATQVFTNSQTVGQSTDYTFSGYFATFGPLNYQPYIVISAHTDPGNYLYCLAFFNASTGTFSGKTINSGWSEINTLTATLATCGMWFVTWTVRFTQPALLRTRVMSYLQIGNAAGSTTYTADGASGIQRACHQFEVGSTATSYIPTTSAQVTRAADVVTGSGLIYTDVPETDYAAWVGGTTYTALTDYVIRTTATTHKVYQCLVTHTTAATPEDNTTGATPKWLEIGPTNRWGMFDRKVGTETTKATSMTYLLKPGRANSLGLLGVDADSVEVSLISNGETVYVASVDLNSGNSVGDWYQYFYEPIYQVDAVAITNLLDAALMAIPAYGDGVLCVRFLATTGNVTCGVMAVGLYAELGLTQYEPTIGIIDYSRKSVDAFGNYDITERTYSKRMSATLEVDAADVDNTARLLTQYRATPVVWVGADNLYSSLIIYGFCKDWEETIKGPSHSICSIQIEGLT